MAVAEVASPAAVRDYAGLTGLERYAILASAMSDVRVTPTDVVSALRERLVVLAQERVALADRVHDLEAELETTRQAAQRYASEVVHLESLVAFYEHGNVGQASVEAPEAEMALNAEAPQEAAPRPEEVST